MSESSATVPASESPYKHFSISEDGTLNVNKLNGEDGIRALVDELIASELYTTKQLESIIKNVTEGYKIASDKDVSKLVFELGKRLPNPILFDPKVSLANDVQDPKQRQSLAFIGVISLIDSIIFIKESKEEDVMKSAKEFLKNAGATLSQDEEDELSLYISQACFRREERLLKHALEMEFEGFDRAAIQAKARFIAETEDPVKFWMKVFHKFHPGDHNLGITLLASISVQQSATTNGIQPNLNGPLGGGKSDAADTGIHLSPPEWVLKTSLTPKALFYDDRLKDGMIINSDDNRMTPELEDHLKIMLSDYQNRTNHTTVSDGTAKRLTAPARIALWLSSMNAKQSKQFMSRTAMNDIEDSEPHREAVFERQTSRREIGERKFLITEDVLICRELIRDLKKQPLFHVAIPDLRKIGWTDKKRPRNYEMFCDFIEAFAIMRFRQRTIDSNGKLLATMQDINDALALYNKSSMKDGLNLTGAQRKLCQALADMGGRASQAELAKKMGVSTGYVSTIVGRVVPGKPDIENEKALEFLVPGFTSEIIREENGKIYYTIDNPLFPINEVERLLKLRPISDKPAPVPNIKIPKFEC